MNEYESKRETRRERYLELADKADSEANRRAEQGSAMLDVIPFGQPILVGHHSEGRDRRYRARMGKQFDKSREASKKAAYYRGKAASMDYAGVSSDDPDAAAKLREKLAELEAKQKRMKDANRIIRAALRKHEPEERTVAALVAIGFPEAVATARLSPDPLGDVGFPTYALSNNTANIRRYRQRLAQLVKANDRQSVTEVGGDFTFRLDADENRVLFEFDGRPDADTRTLLKREGFRWSPSRTAWVRQWTANGEHAGRRVQAALAAR